MPKQTNIRRLKTKPRLTPDEVQRIAEKLAVALEHNSENTSLMTMLFDHLQVVSNDHPDVWSSIYTIKRHLFAGTVEADDAQAQFQANAYANRGKLLMWPYERKESK